MNLIDVNLLIYATIPQYPQHPAAYHWLLKQLRESPRVGIPWNSLLGFVRIAINPKIHQKPVSVRSALEQVSEWLSQENVWVPEPSANHWEILTDILEGLPSNPSIIPDAHLAAIAMGHGLQLCSADNDFSKFKGLNWVNPLT